MNIPKLQGTVPAHSKLQVAILIAALLYWFSPIDLIPLVPIDDIIVMALAYLNYIKVDAQEVG